MAAILAHNVTMLVAAHLPGSGTQYFGRDVTLDVEDLDKWRQWVVA